MSKWFWMGLALCWGIAGLAFYAWMSETREAGRLWREGVAVEATVTDLEHLRRVRTGSGGGTQDTYMVSVSYTSEGESHTARESVRRAFFRGLTLGQTIEVRHAPGTPDRVEVAPGGTAANAAAAGWVSLGFFVAGLALGGIGRSVARVAREMAERGREAVAEITAILGNTSTRTFVVRRDGATETEHVLTMRLPPELANARIGDRITIVYDPEGKLKSRLPSDLPGRA